MTLAKRAAVRSDHRIHKIGCVIARGNKIIGIGWNILKTHPKSPHKYKSIHAEFMASINAGDIKGATAYVFRQQKNGVWANSKPCASCWQYLMDLGIKEIVYSFEGYFKKEKVA